MNMADHSISVKLAPEDGEYDTNQTTVWQILWEHSITSPSSSSGISMEAEDSSENRQKLDEKVDKTDDICVKTESLDAAETQAHEFEKKTRDTFRVNHSAYSEYEFFPKDDVVAADKGSSDLSCTMKRRHGQACDQQNEAKKLKLTPMPSTSTDDSPYPVGLINNTGNVPKFYPISSDSAGNMYNIIYPDDDSNQNSQQKKSTEHVSSSFLNSEHLFDNSQQFSGYISSKQIDNDSSQTSLKSPRAPKYVQLSPSGIFQILYMESKPSEEKLSEGPKGNVSKVCDSREEMSAWEADDQVEVYLDNAEADSNGDELNCMEIKIEPEDISSSGTNKAGNESSSTLSPSEHSLFCSAEDNARLHSQSIHDAEDKSHSPQALEDRSHSPQTADQSHLPQAAKDCSHASQASEDWSHSPQVADQSHSSKATEDRSYSHVVEDQDQSHSSQASGDRSHSPQASEDQSHSAQASEDQLHSAQASEDQSHSPHALEDQSHSSQATKDGSYSPHVVEDQSHSSRASGDQSHSAQASEDQSHSAQSSKDQSHSAQASEDQSHSAQASEDQSYSAQILFRSACLHSLSSLSRDVCQPLLKSLESVNQLTDTPIHQSVGTESHSKIHCDGYDGYVKLASKASADIQLLKQKKESGDSATKNLQLPEDVKLKSELKENPSNMSCSSSSSSSLSHSTESPGEKSSSSSLSHSTESPGEKSSSSSLSHSTKSPGEKSSSSSLSHSTKSPGEKDDIIQQLENDNRELVYQSCCCTEQSPFEIEEAKVWRTVKTPGKGYNESRLMPNLGLLKFMDRNLFSFSRNGRLYIYLSEVMYRGLLPNLDEEVEFIRSDAVWPLITNEVRELDPQELLYVNNYGLQITPTWLKWMITPKGLLTIYQQLEQLKGCPNYWSAYLHTIFYRQRLGHHCAWSLQVTPPTGRYMGIRRFALSSSRRINTVVKTLTRVHLDPVTNKQNLVMAKLCDGGAGTEVANHKMSPFLSDALKQTIKTFHLEDIVEPYCSCNLNVENDDSYWPMRVHDFLLYHVTPMNFLNSEKPLHCWKRNNGFFVSLNEIVHNNFLPTRGHELLEMLLSSAKDGSNVSFMLEIEILFLNGTAASDFIVQGGEKSDTSGQLAEATQSGHVLEEDQRKGIHVSGGTVDQISATNASTDISDKSLNQENPVRNRENLKGRQDILVSLSYLHKMYVELAKVDTSFRKHAEARFYIHYWPHVCPLDRKAETIKCSEKDGNVETEGKSDAEEVPDLQECHLDKEKSVELVCVGDQEVIDKEVNVVECNPSKMQTCKEDAKSVTEGDEDIQILEDFTEKEIIDLVDSSCEEDESNYNEDDRTNNKGQNNAHVVKPLTSANKTHHLEKHIPVLPVKQEPVGRSDLKEGLEFEKLKTGPNEVHQELKLETTDLTSKSHDPEYIERKSGHVSSNLGFGSQGLGHELQLHGTQHCVELPLIKQEMLEEVDADLLDLGIIEHDADDSDLPVTFISKQQKLIDANTPGDRFLNKEGVIDNLSDSDSDCSDNETVLFLVSDFPHSCSCPVESGAKLLMSSSILQSFFKQRTSSICILDGVGQAIIGSNLLYTFYYSGTLYFSVAQLQDVGLIMWNVDIVNFRFLRPRNWFKKMTSLERSFLNNNGCAVTFPSHSQNDQVRLHLISAELLSFLSYENQYLVQQTIRQTDIYVHRIGHICPVVTSRAHEVQQYNQDLCMVMKAWTKSFYWQKTLQDIEKRRRSHVYQHTCPNKMKPEKVESSCPEEACTELSLPDAPEHQVKKSKHKSRIYSAADCSIYYRRFKISDMTMEDVLTTGSKSFCACSPSATGGTKVVKKETVPEEGGKLQTFSKTDTCEVTSNIKKFGHACFFEGALIPKQFKNKNQILKTGLGFMELDYNTIISKIGNKSNTHHLVLTGTLTTGVNASDQPLTFSCFKDKDKVYISWGELAAHFFGIDTIYVMAKKLHVFLYQIPMTLAIHMSHHYATSKHTMSSSPWICVNSINAVSWLGRTDDWRKLLPKTFTMLEEHFQKTDQWNLSYRNFVLIAKEEFVPM